METATAFPPQKTVWRYSLKRERALEIRESERCRGPAEIAAFLRGLGLQDEEQEHFLSVVLDTKSNIKAYSTVTIGLIDRSHTHAREVFRHAIFAGAAKIVLAHNHPSGDPTPSKGDIDSTEDLVAAGKIVGIEVIDHVIIGQPAEGRKDYLSFREEGLLEPLRDDA